MSIYYTFYPSPVGDLLLAGDERSLSIVGFPSGKGKVRVQPEWQHDSSALRQAMDQLTLYFSGELKKFNLRIAPRATEFEKNVYAALQEIPYGETRSYAEIARQIGKPNATRAVGAANGRNPIPIIIPCHRVIGSDGSLTGFGGGLETKRYLLNLESGQQEIF